MIQSLIKRKHPVEKLRLAYADELWAMGKETKAFLHYRSLLNSNSEKIKEFALYRSGKYLEDRRKPNFKKYFLKMIQLNPASTRAGEALWLIGRDYLRYGKNNHAIKYFEESLLKDPEGKNSDQCRFWLFKLYRNQNDKVKSNYYITKLININPDSTYTWRLIPKIAKRSSYKKIQQAFINALSRDDEKAAFYYHVLMTCREKTLEKHYKRIDKLSMTTVVPYERIDRIIFDEKNIPSNYLTELDIYFSTGYRKGINRTISMMKVKKIKPEYISSSICRFAFQFGNHFYSIYNLQELYKSLQIKENIFLQSNRLNKLLLPRPFLSNVSKNSKRFTINQNKIYAVIKAESLFNHQALSPAGATGFMQLMPATASGIASQLKMNEYNLKNPLTSIEMGAQYISWLNRYFKGNFDFIVAGYNAGAGNVNKWKKKKYTKIWIIFLNLFLSMKLAIIFSALINIYSSIIYYTGNKSPCIPGYVSCNFVIKKLK